MSQVLGHQEKVLAERHPNQCFCAWRPGVECPNDYTHVIENLAKPGYMKCCEQHMAGFLRICTGPIKVWTKSEWEAAGREQALILELGQ